MISSFRRKPESRLFTNHLILKQKTLDPGFHRGDVYRVFVLMWESQSFFITLKKVPEHHGKEKSTGELHA